MKTKQIGVVLRPLLSAALLTICTSNAYAATPNILGSYSGTEDGTLSACTDPADNETYTGDPLTLDITSQTGGSFTGSVTDPDSTTILTGTVDAAGNISGSYSDGDGSGTFSGTISGGSITLNYSGSETSTGCSTSGTFTGTGGGTVYVPNTAPSTALTTQQALTTSVATFSTAVTQRLTTLRTQNNTNGATKTSSGFMLQDGSGMSSGDGLDGPLGIWGSINHSQSEPVCCRRG